jgi:hypothetical protein
VEHPAGFAILDLDARARTERGVRAVLVRSLPGSVQVPTLVRVSGIVGQARAPRARWVAEVAAYLRPRLRLALGLAPGDDLARFLFRHPATVAVSAEAVTVELSLDTLPIEIRVAGLDRDLGWLPAAGRALAFRFS